MFSLTISLCINTTGLWFLCQVLYPQLFSRRLATLKYMIVTISISKSFIPQT